MPIPVVCSKCSAKLNAPDNAAGKRVKCPRCQTAMVVPELLAAEMEPQFEVVDDAPPPAKKLPAKPKVVAQVELDDDDDRPRKKRRPVDDEDDDDDRPRKKRKKSDEGGVSTTRNVVMGVLLVVLLGVAGYVFYDRSQKKETDEGGSSSKKDPEVKPVIPPPPGGGPGGMVPPPPLPGENPPPKKKGGKPIGTPGQPTTMTSPAGFKVTFPGPYVTEELPKRIQDQVGLPIKLYVSEDPADPAANTACVAAIIDFAPGTTAADRKSGYDRVVKSLTDGPKKPQVTRKSVMAGGKNWEEITIQDGQLNGVMRLLQTDTHVFVLIVHFGKVPSPELANRYFDSFQFTN